MAILRLEPSDPREIERNPHKNQRTFRLGKKNRYSTEQAGRKDTSRAEAALRQFICCLSFPSAVLHSMDCACSKMPLQ